MKASVAKALHIRSVVAKRVKSMRRRSMRPKSRAIWVRVLTTGLPSDASHWLLPRRLHGRRAAPRAGSRASAPVVPCPCSSRPPARAPPAERLLRALEARQAAGGDRRGTHSAALRVVRREAYPCLDLHVDEHADPIPEARRVHGVWRAAMLPHLPARPTRPGLQAQRLLS